MIIKWILILIVATFHNLVTYLENKQDKPPGKLIDMGGYFLHLYEQGEGTPTVIIEHSLGGIDGYFLIDEIAKITQVCIYDRSGYGWSDTSVKSRCSEDMVQELDNLLKKANIEPPYILVGDSFGSYNVRLYAHLFPEKVAGVVLTDGLYEQGMLKMSPVIKALKLFFLSGFIMSIIGSTLGFIRVLGMLGIFELIKPELRHFKPEIIRKVKRSFYRPKHWLNMAREIWNLDKSSRQVSQAQNLGNIPLVSIKAKTFLKPSIFNFYLPIKAANKLRDKMHIELLKLSVNSTQLQADKSSHFVWLDQPEMILEAIEIILKSLK